MDLAPRPYTRVDIGVASNSWWDDSFQYGDPEDQTWTLTNKSFYCSIKVNDSVSTPVLVTFSTGGGTILVTDAVNRIITMNVTDIALRAALPSVPYTYVYDLLMVDNVTGQTDVLQYGIFQFSTGMTIGPS